jgi:hypothetical protein
MNFFKRWKQNLRKELDQEVDRLVKEQTSCLKQKVETQNHVQSFLATAARLKLCSVTTLQATWPASYSFEKRNAHLI